MLYGGGGGGGGKKGIHSMTVFVNYPLCEKHDLLGLCRGSATGGMNCSGTDLQSGGSEGAGDVRSPSRPNILHFHAVCRKKKDQIIVRQPRGGWNPCPENTTLLMSRPSL